MIDPILRAETIEDTHTLARRLATRPCPITRSKLNKHLREGGKVELLLPIYASSTVAAATPGGVASLATTALRGPWWSTRDRLLAAVPIPTRWEHVTPVRTAIDEAVAASHLDPTAFAAWFATATSSRWSICLISTEEDSRLRARDPAAPWSAYTAAGITVAGLVRGPL